MLKTEAEIFQQLPRDLANVNALENNVRSLLLHKFNHNAEKTTKVAEHYFRLHRYNLADSLLFLPGMIKSDSPTSRATDFWGRASEKLLLARPRTSAFSRPLQS